MLWYNTIEILRTWLEIKVMHKLAHMIPVSDTLEKYPASMPHQIVWEALV